MLKWGLNQLFNKNFGMNELNEWMDEWKDDVFFKYYFNL